MYWYSFTTIISKIIEDNWKIRAVYVSFDNQKRATSVKWNGTELFDQRQRIVAQFIKALLLSVDGSERQNGAALLLSNTLRAYLFYYSYLLRDKSCRRRGRRGRRGRLHATRKRRRLACRWAERHAHFFLFIAVWEMLCHFAMLSAMLALSFVSFIQFYWTPCVFVFGKYFSYPLIYERINWT